MRFAATVAGVCCLLLLNACGTTGPMVQSPVHERPSDHPSELEAARTEYFEGVRAYVQDDLESARLLLESSQTRIAVLADLAVLDELDTEDAESIHAKADYFLVKIAEDEQSPQLAEAEDASAEPAAPAGGWHVEHGTIERPSNDDVERWMRYFLGDGRAVFQKWLNRRSLFLPEYEITLARHSLPSELVYHSMIESGFSKHAYSWAHAVGPWQFIRSTGRVYGLRCDWWVDERRDIARATDAACRYLRDLYVEFQDWELALAAYNVGEARVRRQIRKQNTRNFWELKLPRETRNHIPKFYAALAIGTEAEKYGFVVETPAPAAADTILVDDCVDFEVIAECAGTTAAVLADLNPSLVRSCTPPDEKSFPLLVPAGSGSSAQTALAALPAERRIRWARHQVSRGETLSQIASRYRTSVHAVAEANKLRSMHFLSVGQTLLVPHGAAATRFASHDDRPASSNSSSKKSTYVVRKGDTLSQIAERNGTTVSNLKRWNRIGRYIKPGQRLAIHGGSSSPRYASNSSDHTVVKVRRGDTLWDIARKFGVSLSALLHANNLSRADLIRPGDTIRVPRRAG